MAVKLIALDMDGTTLNDDGIISRRNREALNKAARKGVNIVVATGRPRSALPKDVFEMSAIRYALTSNGARITDLIEEKSIYENCMSSLAAESAVRLLQEYHYVIECFIDGVAYIEKEYYEKVKKSGKSFRSVSYILNTRNPVEDIYSFILEHKNSIENINVNFEDTSEKPAMREKLMTIPQSTTSKAEALKHMCRMMGIDQKEMMAVGDSPNDIAMLKASGLPVAVGNAKDEVKAVAKYIAPTNHMDGVADAVEKFVLKE